MVIGEGAAQERAPSLRPRMEGRDELERTPRAMADYHYTDGFSNGAVLRNVHVRRSRSIQECVLGAHAHAHSHVTDPSSRTACAHESTIDLGWAPLEVESFVGAEVSEMRRTNDS